MKHIVAAIFLLVLCIHPKANGIGFFTTAFWQSGNALKFTTGAVSQPADICSTGITVQTFRAGSVAFMFSPAVEVTFTATGSAQIFSDPGCTQPVSSVTLTATSVTTIYTMSPVVESYDVIASASGFAQATQTENAVANTFYWRGTLSSNWSTGGNWSGGVVPGASDVAVFDGTCTNCSPTFTGAVNIRGIRLASTYTGTIAQDTYDMTFGTGGITIEGGTFTAHSNPIYKITLLNGTATVDGGTFTLPGGYFYVHGSWRVYGTSTVNIPSGSTIDFECGTSYSICNSAVVTIVPGSIIYENIEMRGRTTHWSLTDPMTAAKNLTVGATAGQSRLTGNINVYGTNVNQDTGGMWGSTIILKGNAAGQTITGAALVNFPKFEIDTGVLNVTLSGFVRTQGWRVISVGTMTTTSSTLELYCGSTAYSNCYAQTVLIDPGTVVYNDVNLYGFSTDWDFLGATMTIAGTLYLGDISSAGRGISNGTIHAYNHVYQAYNGYRTNSNFSIIAKGNASGQTIMGNAGLNLPILRVDAGTNPVTISGTLRVQAFNIDSVGTFTSTGSTLEIICSSGSTPCYAGVSTINLGTVNYNNLYFHGYASSYDLGGSSPNVLGTFEFGDQNSVSRYINNGTINAYGDVTMVSSGNRGTAVIRVAGNAAGQTVTGSATTGKEFPELWIDAGTNAVTLTNLIRPAVFKMVSVGTFTTTGNTLEFYSANGMRGYATTLALDFGGKSYNNISFHGWSTEWDLSGSSANVMGTLTVGDQNSVAKRIFNGTLNAYGDVVQDNNGHIGNALIVLKGNAGGQTISGTGVTRNLPYVEIDAGANPVTLSGTVRTNWFKVISVGTFTSTGSTLEISCTYSSFTDCYNTTSTSFVPGGLTYNNLSIKGNLTNYDLGGATVNVNGRLTIGDVSALRNLNNASFIIKGGMTVLPYGNNGNASFTFDGTGAQTIAAANNPVPSGTWLFAPTGGGSITLSSSLNLPAGVSTTVASGTFNVNTMSFNIPGTLTVAAGATVNRNGGSLTYGALVNNGTINP